MEVAGLVIGIVPLALGCTKIIRMVQDVRTKYKRAPLVMTSIATECSTMSVALSQLNYVDFRGMLTSTAREPNSLNQVLQSIDAVIIGCSLTLSVIEDTIVELQDSNDDSGEGSEQTLGRLSKARIVWHEDEMKELLQQLRGYQLNLTTLLTVIQSQSNQQILESNNEIRSMVINQGTVIGTLLSRTHTSRRKRPTSTIYTETSELSVNTTNTDELNSNVSYEFDQEVSSSRVYQRVGAIGLTTSNVLEHVSLLDDSSLAGFASLNIFQTTAVTNQIQAIEDPVPPATMSSEQPEESHSPIARDDFLHLWKDYERRYIKNDGVQPVAANSKVSDMTSSEAIASELPVETTSTEEHVITAPEVEPEVIESTIKQTLTTYTTTVETVSVESTITSSKQNGVQSQSLAPIAETEETNSLENQATDDRRKTTAANHLAKSREALKTAGTSILPPKTQVVDGEPAATFRLLLTGDKSRTRLALSYIYKTKFPDYVPSMLPDVVLNYLVGTPEKLYNLELKDFYGDDYDRLRPLNYVIVDVVMLCFSIMSPQSLVAVEDTWAPEAKKFVPNAPTVLVGIRGTCFDEEDDETDASMEARLRKMNLEPVTEVAARRVMERIGAVEYVECNLQEMEDMETAFKQALCAVLQPIPTKRRSILPWRRKS